MTGRAGFRCGCGWGCIPVSRYGTRTGTWGWTCTGRPGSRGSRTVARSCCRRRRGSLRLPAAGRGIPPGPGLAPAEGHRGAGAHLPACRRGPAGAVPAAEKHAGRAAAPAAAGAAPIVGRVAERKALLAAYARVVAGRPQVLLITGAAGIGKTRLVEELCALAESAAGGARVLLGESAPLAGAALAYGPFVAALRDHAGWLLADDRTPDMLAARHRLFLRVLELLAGLATSHRSYSCWRTCTGPTTPPASCSPSWRSGCVTSRSCWSARSVRRSWPAASGSGLPSWSAGPG